MRVRSIQQIILVGLKEYSYNERLYPNGKR